MRRFFSGCFCCLTLVLLGCKLSSPVQLNETYEAKTDDWHISFTMVSEMHNKEIIVTEKMVATYQGSLESLQQYDTLNISCKTPFTETWFSEPINLTQVKEKTFELEGAVAIKTAQEPLDVVVNITLGETVKEIVLEKVY